MEPNYEWLQRLERRNGRKLLLLLRELKRVREIASGPVLISDIGPTEGGMRLPTDQTRLLREDRAMLLDALLRHGFISSAEHDPVRHAFQVEADESIVRQAIGTLAGPKPPAALGMEGTT